MAFSICDDETTGTPGLSSMRVIVPFLRPPSSMSSRSMLPVETAPWAGSARTSTCLGFTGFVYLLYSNVRILPPSRV